MTDELNKILLDVLPANKMVRQVPNGRGGVSTIQVDINKYKRTELRKRLNAFLDEYQEEQYHEGYDDGWTDGVEYGKGR